jgi:ParB family chromosome partitioning protein
MMPKFAYIGLESILVEEGLRKTLGDDNSLDELTASIARHGVLQPITVEPVAEEGYYRLLIGERRTKAARKAGLNMVPAQILEKALKPDEALETRLVENLQREDLDPLDEAEAYAALKAMRITISAIARRVGKSRPYVSKRMRLLKLHPKVREAVRRRTITVSHAQTLLRLRPEQQLMVLEEIREDPLTEKETRKRVRGILGKPLKWHLVPVRFSREVYEKLKDMAPKGDVKRLIQQTIWNLIPT